MASPGEAAIGVIAKVGDHALKAESSAALLR